MKTTNKSAKYESLSFFVFIFALARERIFIKTHNVETRFDIGPENRPLAGVCVQFAARKCTGWGSEGVKTRVQW